MERKRKRAEEEAAERADAQIRGNGQSPPSPTEEEVEEFFAILRRMRVAVRYFQNAAASKDGEDGSGSVDVAKPDGGGVDEQKAAADGSGKREAIGALDLNAVPDE